MGSLFILWSITFPHVSLLQVVGGGERLVIAGAGVGDSGAYSCRANNSAGEDVKVVWVEVMAPPRINTTALPGNPTVLNPGH